jgi:hypothetical protein
VRSYSPPHTHTNKDPGTFDQTKLWQYIECGVNRVSLGVQSWNENELKGAGRAHSLKDCTDATKMIADAYEQGGLKRQTSFSCLSSSFFLSPCLHLNELLYRLNLSSLYTSPPPHPPPHFFCLIIICSLTHVYQALKTWSMDLISGLPHMTPDSWQRSLNTAVKTGAPHLSLYDLQVTKLFFFFFSLPHNPRTYFRVSVFIILVNDFI